MYAVLCSPQYWQMIEQTIISRDQILMKATEADIDTIAQIEKVKLKHLIIDITAINDNEKLIKSIEQIKTLHCKIQIIIIAPNYEPGNGLLRSIVSMGVYDIIAPIGKPPDVLDIVSLLIKYLDYPSTYDQASKWIIADTDSIESQEPTALKKKEKGKSKEVVNNVLLKEVIRNVPMIRKGLKDTVISWGWNNSGKSFLLTNLAVMLAKAGAKVALVEGNILNRELFTFFEVDDNHNGLDSLLHSNSDNVLDYAYSPVKNLYVFAALPFSKLKSDDFDLITIQDKLHSSVDFILIDNPFLLDDNFVKNLKYVTKVLLPVTPSVAKLFALSKTLESIYSQGVNLSKFDVILNQYLSSKEFTPEAIEIILNQDLSLSMNNPEATKRMINITATVPPMYPLAYESHIIGKPLTLNQKGETLAKALGPVLNSIWAVENHKKGLLSIFKRS